MLAQVYLIIRGIFHLALRHKEQFGNYSLNTNISPAVIKSAACMQEITTRCILKTILK